MSTRLCRPKRRQERVPLRKAHQSEKELQLVVIRTYQHGVAADLAKSLLQAAGIPSMIRGDDGRRYYYGYGLALYTGIELLVRAEDAKDAEKILDDTGGGELL